MARDISIAELVDMLGLEPDPRTRYEGAANFNVRCPFCGGKGYKMNINTVKNTYHCFRCSGDDKHTGVLDLYGRVRFNTPLIPGPGGNAKELSARLRTEAGDSPSGRWDYTGKDASPRDILPADDEVLDRAYSALLKLEPLKLSDAHRENLLERGFSPETIERNGYASLRKPGEWPGKFEGYPDAVRRFYASGIPEARKDNARLRRMPALSLIAGFIIAEEVEKRGAELSRVPGFYSIAGCRMFNYDAGMLIPTRNRQGRIVGLQIRRDTEGGSGARYLTVSSKGLPEGPTANISRTHFPLGNAADAEGLPDCGRVILTEGPLKADAASELYGGPTYFMALQGVDNARELPETGKLLYRAGVRTVWSAFDMDKLVNPYVARAGRKARQKLAAYGIRLVPLLWDCEGTERYAEELKAFFGERDICWKEKADVYSTLAVNISELLRKDRNSYEAYIEGHPWKGAKGIDDYLKEIRKGIVRDTIDE